MDGTRDRGVAVVIRRDVGDFTVFCIAVSLGIVGGVAVLAVCTIGGSKVAGWVTDLTGSVDWCSW